MTTLIALALLAVVALGVVVSWFRRVDDLPAVLSYQDNDFRYEVAGITGTAVAASTQPFEDILGRKNQ